MTDNSKLFEIISDPILGPFEGEDFCIDEQGYIQVYDRDPKKAALICRKVNASKEFTQTLVKIAHKGDSIILGFDDLAIIAPVFTTQIGYLKSVLVEVRCDKNGKFSIYLDKKRSSRIFNKLASAKTFIKKLDKDLQSTGETIANYEESDD